MLLFVVVHVDVCEFRKLGEDSSEESVTSFLGLVWFWLVSREGGRSDSDDIKQSR